MICDFETVVDSALFAGISAQKEELIVLTKAPNLSKDKKVNIFAKRTFDIAHTHRAIYQ